MGSNLDVWGSNTSIGVQTCRDYQLSIVLSSMLRIPNFHFLWFELHVLMFLTAMGSVSMTFDALETGLTFSDFSRLHWCRFQILFAIVMGGSSRFCCCAQTLEAET